MSYKGKKIYSYRIDGIPEPIKENCPKSNRTSSLDIIQAATVYCPVNSFSNRDNLLIVANLAAVLKSPPFDAT